VAGICLGYRPGSLRRILPAPIHSPLSSCHPILQPDFMREDPLSWMWGWRRQNDAIKGVQVQNGKRTLVEEGATEPGLSGLGLVGLGWPAWRILPLVRSPISWVWRWYNPKELCVPPFAEGAVRPRGNAQERGVREERDHSQEGSI
jgi:hypothetical protein